MKNFQTGSNAPLQQIPLPKDIKRKVEDMGVTFEKVGYAPMAARIFAFLLLAEPAYQSFDGIRNFLGASKSAVSNALTLLQHEGIVSYLTFNGDRKRYFKIDTEHWLQRLIEGTRSFSVFNEMLKGVYEYRKKTASGEFNKELLKLLEFQDYLSKKIDLAVADWQNN